METTRRERFEVERTVDDAMFSLRPLEWTPTAGMGSVTSVCAGQGSLFVGTARCGCTRTL